MTPEDAHELLEEVQAQLMAIPNQTDTVKTLQFCVRDALAVADPIGHLRACTDTDEPNVTPERAEANQQLLHVLNP